LFWAISFPVAAQETVIARADAVKWKAGPLALPNGAETAILVGDPAKEGPYVLRIKIPAGFKIAPHSHPNDENLTVISGTYNLGIGEKYDESKAEPVRPGGFAYIPKGMQHYGWADGDTVFQLHSVGPSAFNYVAQADDPRKGSGTVVK
jgi:quercetin dioxygenase-like cupin family protein